MTNITVSIDISDGGGDLLFLKPETTPETRRLIIELGSKLVKQDIKIDLIKENQIKENIKVEIEKLLLPTLNKWFENDLKKMIKKHLDDQINELKKNN